jgi:DNA mismatch repair protein MutL
VHPSKREVRLANEATVAETLRELVSERFARAVSEPPSRRQFALGPLQYSLRTTNRRLADGGLPDQLWPGRVRPRDEILLSELSPLCQWRDTLILAGHPHGLALIDQHRAHERVIFEQLTRERNLDRIHAQSLLDPLLIEIGPDQARRLAPHLPELEEMGINCERLSGLSFLVRSVPRLEEGLVDGTALKEALNEALVGTGRFTDDLWAALACRCAVRRGTSLTLHVMRRLLARLAEAAAPTVCPHGSPVILHLSQAFLEQQFRWR